MDNYITVFIFSIQCIIKYSATVYKIQENTRYRGQPDIGKAIVAGSGSLALVVFVQGFIPCLCPL